MTAERSRPGEVGLLKRFRAEEQQATSTLAAWIGHPAVRSIIERRQVGAETVVAPIARHLVSQREVARFCWHVYGIAGIDASWNLRRGEPWLLTVGELNVIGRVEADFRGVVQLAVNELASAGVGLVPSWDGDHAAVGELLLLPVPWELPARELAACLNPPGIGAIHVDASGTTHRRGTGERAETNLGAIRRNYEQHLHGPRPRAAYADGGTRAVPEPTRRRREAIAKVLEKWPDTTASKIATSFADPGRQRGGLPRSPGGFLCQLLQDACPGEVVRCPSKSTLHADLRALRADKKRSG